MRVVDVSINVATIGDARAIARLTATPRGHILRVTRAYGVRCAAASTPVPLEERAPMRASNAQNARQRKVCCGTRTRLVAQARLDVTSYHYAFLTRAEHYARVKHRLPALLRTHHAGTPACMHAFWRAMHADVASLRARARWHGNTRHHVSARTRVSVIRHE